MLYSLCNKCGTKIPYREKYCDKCLSVVMEEKQYRNKVKSSKYNADRYSRDRENNSYRLFYSSKDWREKRKEILERDNHACVICSELYRITMAQDVHHILNLRENYDLRLDNDNLISLCSDHHKMVHSFGADNKEKLLKLVEHLKLKDEHIAALESIYK